MSAGDDRVRVERDGAIATIVLNRPEKLNALTRDMWGMLGTAVDALSADEAVRCIIVRGAGERAFSPGNDIAEFATQRANKSQAIEYGEVMHRTADADAVDLRDDRVAAGSRSPRCAISASAGRRAASARRSRTWAW